MQISAFGTSAAASACQALRKPRIAGGRPCARRGAPRGTAAARSRSRRRRAAAARRRGRSRCRAGRARASSSPARSAAERAGARARSDRSGTRARSASPRQRLIGRGQQAARRLEHEELARLPRRERRRARPAGACTARPARRRRPHAACVAPSTCLATCPSGSRPTAFSCASRSWSDSGVSVRRVGDRLDGQRGAGERRDAGTRADEGGLADQRSRPRAPRSPAAC